MRRFKSKTYVRRLREVFDPLDDEVRPHVVRLVVLYEDLRLELAGSSGPGLQKLETAGELYRRLYFTRRSLVTLVEVSACIGALNKLAVFRAEVAGWQPQHRADWQAAVRFFKQNHWTLKTVRNDFGGHFSYEAAKSAVATIDPHTADSLEFQPDWEQNSTTMIFKFATEVVGAGLSRHRQPEQKTAAYLKELFALLLEAWRHAAKAVHGVGELMLRGFAP